MVAALAMQAQRPVIVLDVFGGSATEGTVFPTMTDTDGLAADVTLESTGCR